MSEVFLRQARVRFPNFPFVEYKLLNIDADPRLQGFAPRQCELLISTNCLHATPYIRNTLHHCKQLLRASGMLVVNEGLATAAFAQITFGMTDGWWLFGESCDPERVWQDSPLLSWRQWQALLLDRGFHHVHCMQGDTFLRGQAVIVGQKAASGNDAPVALRDGVHFFSGGLGGLGLLTTRLLIEGGAQQLVLSSRSDRVVSGSESDWAWLARNGADVRRVCCDASDDGNVRAIVGALHGKCLRMDGIFHAAHQLADAVIANQIVLNFRATYGPKVSGAAALHAASWHAPLRLFNVYSSTAGLMGSPGQAPHSTANAWLDAMTGWRRRGGLRSQGVNWGAVAEIGYAARAGADRRADASGAGAISLIMAIAAMSCTLLADCRNFTVLPADWAKLLAGNSEARGFLAPYFHLRGSAPAQSVDQRTTGSMTVTASSAVGLEAVLELVRRTAGGFVTADAPLMEAGVDSLGAIELRNQLQNAAGEDVSLPSTLVFDHPTARALASMLSPVFQQAENGALAGECSAEHSAVVLVSSRATLPRGVVRVWVMVATAHNTGTCLMAVRWLMAHV